MTDDLIQQTIDDGTCSVVAITHAQDPKTGLMHYITVYKDKVHMMRDCYIIAVDNGRAQPGLTSTGRRFRWSTDVDFAMTRLGEEVIYIHKGRPQNG